MFKCPVSECGKVKKSNRELNRHINDSTDQKHRKEAQKQRTCDTCGRILFNSQGRHLHMRTCFQPHAKLYPASWTADEYYILKQSDSSTAALLTFLCMLSPHGIPEILFSKIRLARCCWGPDGEINKVALCVDGDLTEILLNERQLERSIYQLHFAGLLEVKYVTNELRTFFLAPSVPDALQSIISEDFKWACLVLVSHAFPGTSREIGFGDLGRALIPHFQHCLHQVSDIRAHLYHHSTATCSLFLTLLLSSKFLDRDWKLYVIGLVRDLLDEVTDKADRTYFGMFASQRHREVSRRMPTILTIESLCALEAPVDPRVNALCGKRLRSDAQVLIMKDNCDLDGALEILDQFQPFYRTHTTTIEREEQHHHQFMRGKVHKWKGYFREASDMFYNLLLNSPWTFDATGCNIRGHLVGALCEQRRFPFAECIARDGISTYNSRPKLGSQVQASQLLLSLQLSLAEVLLCHAIVHRAEAPTTSKEKLEESALLLENLKGKFGQTYGSKMNEMRVAIGRALVAHCKGDLTEAYERWNDVCEAAVACGNQITKFVPMVAHYSKSEIKMKLGLEEEALSMRRSAELLYPSVRREHWWTGLGTMWYDFLGLKDRGI